MKTILQVKLLPAKQQTQSLLDTMERFNQACNYISDIAFKEQLFYKFDLHKVVYYDVKDKFGLTAQVVIRAISKVADSYKVDKKVHRSFKKYGAMAYDQRIYSFKGPNLISLWTVNGREKIKMVYGAYQKKRWYQNKGQAQLVYKDNKFYLLISVEAEEQDPIDPEGYLGVDLGVTQIATTSDGESFSGKAVEQRREQFQILRTSLQKCGTKSAKRHLKKIRNKEADYRRNTNRCISKKIVEKAKRTHSAIVLEDLKGIRERIRARKSNRSKMHGWSFFQLRQFIEYKSKLAGIPLHVVNPAYTSQRCSQCGHTSKKNRKTQAEFLCQSCGYVSNADFNASINIALLGHVNRPIVGIETAKSFVANCAVA